MELDPTLRLESADKKIPGSRPTALRHGGIEVHFSAALHSDSSLATTISKHTRVSSERQLIIPEATDTPMAHGQVERQLRTKARAGMWDAKNQHAST
eukprot:3465237-Pleurochrysis_carterae.AAC.2